MKTPIALAALVLGLAPLSSAYAQPAARGGLLRQADANGDGVISKEEVLAARQRLFSRLDRNGDGAIDRDEIGTARDAIMDRAELAQAGLGNAMRRMDANGDGKVSAEEFRDSTPFFDLADRNGDGKLSPDELRVLGSLVASRAR